MCLLILQYRVVPGTPILLAANREEAFGRASRAPTLVPGRPRVLCGIDARAGGTWLGVNEHSLVVAVTNCRMRQLPDQPRSRGLLCRQLLDCGSAAEAADLAHAELASGRYAGVNFVCADPETARIVHLGEQLLQERIDPGHFVLANAPPGDRSDRRIAIAGRWLQETPMADVDGFVRAAAELLSRGPEQDQGVVLRASDRGTVSSSILALADEPANCRYRYAPGPPDRTPFDDYDESLQSILRRAN